ncbi:MAG TPA: putative PEP-binding protein, partial [Spirochaetia bacterium]|nr:putative PEP-binding protein [Spirochaetia bacterium]
ACVTADKFASVCEFFSFGTNDLTQMGFGFSRDDIGSFLPHYLDKKILPADPFQTIDQEGVGELVKMAITKGRAVKPHLKVGICGEQGGDPESVKFCYKVGLSYVSCSPFRVPLARLAAAQAAISGSTEKKAPAKSAPKAKPAPKAKAAGKPAKKPARKAAKKAVAHKGSKPAKKGKK